MPTSGLGFAVVQTMPMFQWLYPTKMYFLLTLHAQHRLSEVSAYPDHSEPRDWQRLHVIVYFPGCHNNGKGMWWDKHWLSKSLPGCEASHFCLHFTGQAGHMASPHFRGVGKCFPTLCLQEGNPKYLVKKITLIHGAHTCIHTCV